MPTTCAKTNVSLWSLSSSKRPFRSRPNSVTAHRRQAGSGKGQGLRGEAIPWELWGNNTYLFVLRRLAGAHRERSRVEPRQLSIVSPGLPSWAISRSRATILISSRRLAGAHRECSRGTAAIKYCVPGTSSGNFRAELVTQANRYFRRGNVRDEHGDVPRITVAHEYPAKASAGLFAFLFARPQQSIITGSPNGVAGRTRVVCRDCFLRPTRLHAAGKRFLDRIASLERSTRWRVEDSIWVNGTARAAASLASYAVTHLVAKSSAVFFASCACQCNANVGSCTKPQYHERVLLFGIRMKSSHAAAITEWPHLTRSEPSAVSSSSLHARSCRQELTRRAVIHNCEQVEAVEFYFGSLCARISSL